VTVRHWNFLARRWSLENFGFPHLRFLFVHVTFVCLVSRKANDGTDSLGTTRELITYTALLVLLLIVVSFVVLSGGGVFLL
jgi:hypothetical protein